MPRYFFDTYDGDQMVPDETGFELKRISDQCRA